MKTTSIIKKNLLHIFMLLAVILMAGRAYAVHADSFYVSATTVSVPVGSSAVVDIQAYGAGISLNCRNTDTRVATASWGNWSSDNHISLYVYGLQEGSCVLSITGTQNGRDMGITGSILVSVESDYSIYDDYQAELNGAKIAYKSTLEYTQGVSGYFLYDMDGNGMPELIYRTGDYEAEYVYHIMSYSNGSIDCGTLAGGHTLFFDTSLSGSGGLTQIVSVQGYTSSYWHTLKSGSKTAIGYESFSILTQANFKDRVTDAYDPYGFNNSYAVDLGLYSPDYTGYIDEYMNKLGA